MRIARDRASLALAGVLGVGAGLRAWMIATWHPAVVGYHDAVFYVDIAHGPLFADPLHPAGYPLLLRALHVLSASVWPVLVLQHLLGLATAALLYALVRTLTGSRWLGLLPATVIALDGLQIVVEHSLLSDSLFTFLLAAGLYAVARAGAGGIGWALGAGALLAAAGLTRTVGLVAIPLATIALLPAVSGTWRSRAMRAGALLAVAAALVGAYLGAQAAQTGSASLSRDSGWVLYSRVAPFADCSKFTPPAGTAGLCERTPPAARPGTDFYMWDASPAWRVFGGQPHGNAKLGAFARAAIAHQPGDYLAAVAHDFIRYIAPGGYQRPRAGQTPAQFMALSTNTTQEAVVARGIGSYYPGLRATSQSHARLTSWYVRTFAAQGVPMAILLALAIVAPLLVAHGRRTMPTLLTLLALALLIVPVATQVYDARYAVGALGPLSVAAALTLHGARQRLARRRIARARTGWRTSATAHVDR